MNTKFRNACRSGDLEYIKNELEGLSHLYIRHQGEYPHPIFFCASKGKNDCIEYISKKIGCPLESLMESIAIAAISGHLETVDKLFKIAKEFDPRHPRLVHALNVCISKQNKKIVDYLWEKGIYVENKTFYNVK